MKESLFLIIFLIFLTDLCDTISQLSLKHSINRLDLQVNTVKKMIGLLLQLAKIPRVWFGFLFSTLSLTVWLFVLSKAELNFAYSLDSMRYILITIASVIILKENVGPVRWMGIICVVTGIILVASG
jgi:multidrug transporter EmrE-like cation transporter